MSPSDALIDPSTPCVVLELHHGSLAIARSLGRLGVKVHVVGGAGSGRERRSRYFESVVRFDLVRNDPVKVVSLLCDLGDELGGRPVLIPTSDYTAVLVAEHASELSRSFRFVEQDPDLMRRIVSKQGSFDLAREAGIPVPDAEFPKNEVDVVTFAQRATFPVMVKGIDGRKLAARAGIKMKIVHDAAELVTLYRHIEDPDDPNVMLQEYIPGDDDCVWMLDGYFDSDSECFYSVVGRKLRQTPVHTGATSLGVVEPNESIQQLTADFMKRIGYKGLLDVGYRYDARDGGYKLLDPNPRIGSTFRLFTSGDGWDMARIVYADLTDQLARPGEPAFGRKWLIEDLDTASCRAYRAEGTLSLGDWVRSYRGVEEVAWFARDDLGPFWPVFLAFFRRGIRVVAGTIARFFRSGAQSRDAAAEG